MPGTNGEHTFITLGFSIRDGAISQQKNQSSLFPEII